MDHDEDEYKKPLGTLWLMNHNEDEYKKSLGTLWLMDHDEDEYKKSLGTLWLMDHDEDEYKKPLGTLWLKIGLHELHGRSSCPLTFWSKNSSLSTSAELAVVSSKKQLQFLDDLQVKMLTSGEYQNNYLKKLM